MDTTSEVSSMRRNFAYGCISLGSASLNTIFVTFYLEYFIFVVDVPTAWFYGGQLIFMVWNAVNDPLFGWISDTWHRKTPHSMLQQRLRAVLFGGVVWAFSFVVVWHSWGLDDWAGIHFVFSLCLYDGMLTLVEVNQSALLSDLASTPTERATMLQWSAVLGCVGSCTSIAGRLYWSRLEVEPFQKMTMLVAAACAIAFATSHRILRTANNAAVEAPMNERPPAPSLSQFVRQLSQHRNFRYFVFVSMVQQFDCTFEKNFFVLFLDRFAGGTLSPLGHGLVITTSFILPMIGTAATAGLTQRLGLFTTLNQLLQLRLSIVLVALFAMVVGTPRWTMIAFLLCNRVASECCCRIFPLVVSDLTDEDAFLNSRSTSMSATIPGAINFFSKPSQALAPMAGLALLAQQLKAPVETLEQQHWLSCCVAVVPLICVALELVFWRSYSLHGPYHTKVNSYVQDMREAESHGSKIV